MSQFESNPDNVSAERVPEALVDRRRWICWQYAEGGDKKPPYDPETGERASIHDAETWSDFETALERLREGNCDGIGFVLTEDDSITGFDFDDCRDPETGEIEPEVEDIIERLDSYSEVSPSGTGIHTLVIGEKPEEYGSKGGSHIEVYDAARYFTVTGNHLEETPETVESRPDELQRICEVYLSKTPSTEGAEIDVQAVESDSELVEVGKGALHALQDESTPTFNSVIGFLRKGIADFDTANLTKDNGLIDRSSQEYVGISLTYLTMNRYLEEPESRLREITWSVWTHFCQNHPKTAHSQKRRWLEDTDQYRKEIFTNAISAADSEKFEMMVEEKGAGTRRENDEYSKMTYGALWSALFEMMPAQEEVLNLLRSSPQPYNDMDPANPATAEPETDGHASVDQEVHEMYPSKSEVLDRAYEIDNGYNSRRTYEEAFRRLQSEHGQVKAARVGSSTWVYYPVDYSDPPEACYVKLKGEHLDPQEPLLLGTQTDSTEQETEPRIMTDGGTRQPEAKEDLERIRQAREGDDDSSDGPEIFTCPVEGCTRTVVGNLTALQSHVCQSNDDAHKGLRLDESLNLVKRYRIEDDLREEYVEKEKSQQEIADDWGCSRSTIQRWMNRHGIPRRSGMGGGANRVEYATFYTGSNDNGGYERVGSYDPESGGMV
jgi:hypothetical protein